MMLKRQPSEPKPKRFLSALRAAGATLGVAALATSVVVGCLDRPIEPQDPKTSNVFVAEIRQTAVDKIDLLMMIDNSISMADKQSILGDAVGSLVQRLVTPLCVNGDGTATNTSANAEGRCTAPGTSPEFSPIKDIHVGIVSSSLGSHGGGGACTGAEGDDLGQFVATARDRDPMYPFTAWPNNGDKSGGFLAWDPDPARARNNPRGITAPDVFEREFRNMLLNVGQAGCGFESTLEGWYRFLIDPEPLTARTPVVTDGNKLVEPIYNSDAATNIVLQQRAKFLRPDSLLAVVMLSDENDCSIIEAGQGWLVGTSSLGGTQFRMPRATSVCETNPNSPCCVSCLAGTPAGCPDTTQDAQCKTTGGNWETIDDALNLRCFNQKRRFGFDLLYSTQRYVDGLWELTVKKRNGEVVPNPIYINPTARDRSLVFLAGIVGVPWQDIAVNPNDANLRYMTYQQMVDGGRWPMILGTPGDAMTPPTPPGDKLMYETYKDRTTLFGNEPHPVIGADGALAPSTATGRPNVINGHEANIKDNSDLQYACIFKLPQSRPTCSGPGCDCVDATGAANTFNRPLCEGTTQTHAKAFPGTRELQVLKDFGAKGTQNAIVASICPKSLDGDKKSAGYGYNPAVAAIVDRLKEALRGKCLPRKLVPDEKDMNRVPCAVVESYLPPNGEACAPCSNNPGRPGREDIASDDLKVAAYTQLNRSNYCGVESDPNSPACTSFCLCSIQQHTGNNLNRCQTETTTPTDIAGYCYVDPSTTTGDAADKQNQIVAGCPDSQKRLLRFTGDNVPAKGSVAMIACLGASIREN